MWIETPFCLLWLEVSPRGIRRLEPVLWPGALHPGAKEAEGPLAQEVERRLRAYFDRRRPGFSDLPLDYTGLNPLRVAVYEEVRRIPYGEVRSYKEVGQALALSARAVGAALRGCPFFLLVPAHRVVHQDGRLGGFKGLEGLKARLLSLEGLDLAPDGHLKGRKRGAV